MRYKRWDYGQLKLYIENNLKLLQPDDNHEAATMRSYFKVRPIDPFF